MLNTIFHIDQNKPFKFFEDLIFNNSINRVLDLFYTQCIIPNRVYFICFYYIYTLKGIILNIFNIFVPYKV